MFFETNGNNGKADKSSRKKSNGKGLTEEEKMALLEVQKGFEEINNKKKNEREPIKEVLES